MTNTEKTKQQLIDELTALRQRVAQLEQADTQQSRYRQMFERHPAIMLLIDPQTGAIVDANPAACAFYGYSRATLTAMNIADINMLPDVQIQAEMYRAQIEQRTYFVFPHKLASNEIHMVEVRSGPITIDGDVLLFSVIHDITGRLRNERDLRINESRYRVLVDHIPDSAVMLCDQELRVVLAGGPAIEQIGFSKNVEGLMLNEVLDVPYAELLEKNMRTALTGEQFEIELPWQVPVRANDQSSSALNTQPSLKNTSGPLTKKETIWHRYIFVPVADEFGIIYMVMLLVQNITAQKNATQLVRASEERYRRLSELASDYAYSYQVTADGEFLLEWITEDALARITGYTTDDFEHTKNTYHPDDKLRVQQDIDELLAGHQTEGEYRIITKMGEVRWLHMSRYPVWDEQEGRVVHFYGTAKDITKRKKVELALRESEQRHRILAEMTSDFTYYYRVNPDQSWVYEWGAQDALQHISGYHPSEINQTFKLYHPDDWPSISKDLDRVIAGESCTNEYRILTKSGETRWVRIHRRPVWDDAHKRVVGFYGATSDITHYKQAEQTRLAFTLERERVDILSNFITHASHEFRTPLAVINTCTHLLKRLTDPTRQQQQITTIEQQVNHINKLVDNLIMLSGVDNIRELSLSPVHLADVLYAVNDTMQVAQQEKKLSVVLDLSHKYLSIRGNASYLVQAVRQIWENAIQHTPSGGTITVGLTQQNAQAVITITDTGCGISDEDLPQIFKRFFRTDRAGTARGFGLGLPIAKVIVDLHGGSIQAESTPGQGSTFSIRLPLN